MSINFHLKRKNYEKAIVFFSLAEVQVFAKEKSNPTAKVEKSPETQISKKSLVGIWSDGNEKFAFDQNTLKVYNLQDKLLHTTPYRATMSIEDNNNTTLIWHRPDLGKVFKFKPVQ